MKRITQLLLVLVIAVFHSCITDDVSITDPGDEASILVAAGSSVIDETTRAFGDPDPADSKIEQFRILAFKSNGTLVYNEVTDITKTAPYKVQLLTGTYDFVFIGNEDYETNSTLKTQLEALVIGSSTLSSLDALSFPAKAFDSSIKIPMSRMVKNVVILGDNRYIVDGEECTTVWKVAMRRLGVRLDLKITTESSAKKDAFAELHIKNIPVNVPLFEQDASGNKVFNGGPGKYQASPLVIDVSEGDNDGRFEKPSGSDVYVWSVSRIILPSSIFTPDNKDNALILECHYNNSDVSTGVLETGLDDNYQVPRNTYFLANMAITPSLEIYLDVKDWDDILTEADLETKRVLNVSAFNASINQGTRARIWFSSNMPKVVIDTYTSTNTSVNTIFKDLAGTGATNLNYYYDADTREGTGYIDIMTSDNYSGTPTTHRIYLNANGLRREISVTVRSGGSSSERLGYFEYVGAFWRNNQTGERVITGRSSGAWWAEIEVGREWAVVSPGKSTDPNIYTNPGDAENFPVDGNEFLVSGTGQVFFRIGLKDKNPNSEPRYGRIRITTDGGSNHAYIYLRQGEAPDYLMRPEDLGYERSTGKTYFLDKDQALPRHLSAKFSPYNVTAPGLKSNSYNGGQALSGHPTISSNRGGVEVEFPSQAGAFFHWGTTQSNVYAYHPTKPSGQITSFGSSISSAYWDNLNQEICPSGYRRPKSGVTNGRTGGISMKDAEILHSLWINPEGVVSDSKTQNALFGYYADGFFDRWAIGDPPTNTSGQNNVLSSVLASTANVGYSGCLFYNEATNASLFFPCAGERSHSTLTTSNGILRYTGKEGFYWTASSGSDAVGNIIHIISPGITGSGAGAYISRGNTDLKAATSPRERAHNLRCVKAE